ncbi:MAG TPA: cell division protein ZapA [Polyangiaceae bacterium]
MDRRTVELRIGGQAYRVVTSSPQDELQRLADLVESKLAEVGPKGRAQPQALLLAALALAHEVESERGRRETLERRTRDLLRRVLVRIDDALEPYEADSPVRDENAATSE